MFFHPAGFPESYLFWARVMQSCRFRSRNIRVNRVEKQSAAAHFFGEFFLPRQSLNDCMIDTPGRFLKRLTACMENNKVSVPHPSVVFFLMMHGL